MLCELFGQVFFERRLRRDVVAQRSCRLASTGVQQGLSSRTTLSTSCSPNWSSDRGRVLQTQEAHRGLLLPTRPLSSLWRLLWHRFRGGLLPLKQLLRHTYIIYHMCQARCEALRLLSQPFHFELRCVGIPVCIKGDTSRCLRIHDILCYFACSFKLCASRWITTSGILLEVSR